jgi:cytochrome P450
LAAGPEGEFSVVLPRLDCDPREARDPKEFRPIEWVPSLDCWCVFDPEAITAVFKSTDFAAADFTKLHRNMQENVGIDCSALIEVLQYAPTAHEGARHAEIRKDVAKLLTANTAAFKQSTSSFAHEIVLRLCNAGARVDLVREIIRPICDEFFGRLLGVAFPAQDENGVSASQIFDLYLGLNRRKDINARARAMLEAFSKAGDTLKISPGYAVSVSMLGYDSIVGSLSASLLHVIGPEAGERLCDLDFPSHFPVATGVPYVERFAAKDCTIAAAEIRKGDRVRLFLDGGTSENGGDKPRPYFGRGRHSCLGEEWSRWLWQTLIAELSRLPLACTIENAKRRKPDWVFIYYSSIVARFDA